MNELKVCSNRLIFYKWVVSDFAFLINHEFHLLETAKLTSLQISHFAKPEIIYGCDSLNMYLLNSNSVEESPPREASSRSLCQAILPTFIWTRRFITVSAKPENLPLTATEAADTKMYVSCHKLTFCMTEPFWKNRRNLSPSSCKAGVMCDWHETSVKRPYELKRLTPKTESVN